MEFRTIIDIDIKEFDRRVLEKTWEWLNDPEIKELTMTPDFDRESQEAWFQSLPNRKDYFIRSSWRDDEPIAVFGLKKITEVDGELFGYIGEKKYWGKAVTVDMMNYLFDYARSINLQSIYAILLKKNIRSYKFNRRFGFELEKELSDDLIMMRCYLNPPK